MNLQLIHAGEAICSSDVLSDGRSLKFLILEDDRPIEAFLIRFGGNYHAYKNRCAHMALTLDLEDNDFFTIDFQSLICKTHGAVYRPDTGFCFSGPCCGDYLDSLPVEIKDGKVFLAANA